MAGKTTKKTTAKKNMTEKTKTTKTNKSTEKVKKASVAMKPNMTENSASVKKVTNTTVMDMCKSCRGGDSFKLVAIILLFANFIASLLMLNNTHNTVVKAIKTIEAEKVGGTEVYKLREQVYDSPTFKELGKTQAESMIQRLEGAEVPGATTDGQTNTAQPQKISMEDVNKVTEGTYTQGSKNTDYILLEYSDFLCPYCQRQHADGTINAMVASYPSQIRSAFVPNTRGNPTSLKISVAAECAGEQGKFQEFVDAMYKASPSVAQIETIGAEVGVNATSFKNCVDSDKYAEKVNQKMQEGATLFGVRGTPGNVILNVKTGEYILIAGAYPIDEFKSQFEAFMNK